MGRIISGVLGSIRLANPAKASRPTTDRVRESLFGLLEARGYLEGAAVLDLFSGTGALALEAVSRGAASARLIERDRQAIHVIRHNLALATKALSSAGIESDLQLIEGAVKPKLLKLRESGAEFDLIFADPPYDFTDQQIVDELEGISEVLARDGLLVIERAKSGLNTEIADLILSWEKSYGDTRVLGFVHESASEAAD